MRKFLWFLFGYAAGYYYAKNQKKISENKNVKKNIAFLKKTKEKILKKLKDISSEVKKKYTDIKMEVENDEKQEKENKKRK